jgi:parallel beta-helix repeat protein
MEEIYLIKKWMKIIIIFILFLNISLFSINIIEGVSIAFSDGTILYVGGSGPGNYSTIQSAINNSSDGDIIFIYNGIYYEHILINKKISLIGENNYSTIIDGGQNQSSPVVHVVTSPFHICNLTIRNANASSGKEGIEIGYYNMDYTISNSTIIHCKIFNTFDGISFWNSSNILISNCSIFNNTNGVMMVKSKYDRIEHCVLSNRQTGISLNVGSHRNTVINCVISGNATTGLLGEGIETYDDNNIISHCSITNEGDGVAIYANNTRIDNSSLSNNMGRGICIGEGNYNTIENCNVNHNGYSDILSSYGIEVFRGSNNFFTRCEISDNVRGGVLLLWTSEQNAIIKSTIKHNGYTGGLEGVRCESANNIYMNNFIDNYIQAYDLFSNSKWDDGHLGNYWSDYKGHDWNGDEIGEKPYVLFNNSRDHFPLLCPYNPDGPSVLLERPAHNKGDFLYLRNLRFLRSQTTVLVGNINVKTRVANYDNPDRITKVEFYVDGVLRHVDIVPPYIWCWRLSSPLNHMHTLSVIAYDRKGRAGQDSCQVYKLM